MLYDTAICYPFPHKGLGRDDVRRLHEYLEGFAEEYPLYEAANPCTAPAAFVHRCSPSGPTPEALKCMALFMYLVDYYNDMVGAPGYADQVDRFWLALCGELGEPQNALEGATVELRRLLQPWLDAGPHMDHSFFHYVARTWSAFRRESLHLGQLPADMRSYLQIRHHTICVQPFLALWKLLWRLPPRINIEYGPRLHDLESCTRLLVFLANDLGSLTRDIQRSQQNSILIASQERNLSLGQATQFVRDWHDREVYVFVRICEELRNNAAHDRELLWYLDALQTSIAGNTLAMFDLSGRY